MTANGFPNAITVLLADDHVLVRRGFRRLLNDESGISVIAEAGSGREAVKLAHLHRPRVVVMDMAMPDLSGDQASREILRDLPDVAILIVSMYSDQTYVRKALSAGARGYILKSAMDIDLTRAVKELAKGKQVVGAGLMDQPAPRRESPLTHRELEILQLIAEGNSNKEIAALLNLSVNTVSVHRAHIMEGLNVHSTAGLVLYAVRNGLVSIS
jgi:DNA-binding NarL/FixJ family response regulator